MSGGLPLSVEDKKLFTIAIENYRNQVAKLSDDSWALDGYKFTGIPIPESARQKVTLILDRLSNNGYDISTLKHELSILDTEYDMFKVNYELEYKLHLNHLFWYYSDGLNGLGSDSILWDIYEFHHEVMGRTGMEVHSRELECLFDINKYQERMKLRDEIFISTIKEAIVEGTYDPLDNLNAPAEYWWLHQEDHFGKPRFYRED